MPNTLLRTNHHGYCLYFCPRRRLYIELDAVAAVEEKLQKLRTTNPRKYKFIICAIQAFYDSVVKNNILFSTSYKDIVKLDVGDFTIGAFVSKSIFRIVSISDGPSDDDAARYRYLATINTKNVSGVLSLLRGSSGTTNTNEAFNSYSLPVSPIHGFETDGVKLTYLSFEDSYASIGYSNTKYLLEIPDNIILNANSTEEPVGEVSEAGVFQPLFAYYTDRTNGDGMVTCIDSPLQAASDAASQDAQVDHSTTAFYIHVQLDASKKLANKKVVDCNRSRLDQPIVAPFTPAILESKIVDANLCDCAVHEHMFICATRSHFNIPKASDRLAFVNLETSKPLDNQHYLGVTAGVLIHAQLTGIFDKTRRSLIIHHNL